MTSVKRRELVLASDEVLLRLAAVSDFWCAPVMLEAVLLLFGVSQGSFIARKHTVPAFAVSQEERLCPRLQDLDFVL